MIAKKNLEYLEYINEHVSNVKAVWRDLQLQPFDLTGEEKTLLCALVDSHDMSKHNSGEFDAYRQWFYPVEGETKDKELFDKAWNHHQKTNPHHWEYWVLINWEDGSVNPLEMDFAYLIEMLCDWTAMSYKFGDSPSEFYSKNGSKIILNPKTKIEIEKWLPLFDTILKEKEGDE